MTQADRPRVTLLLIRSDPPCRKCRAAEALLRELQEAWPGRAAVRVIRRDEPEAEAYGAVLTPMVVMNGKVVCAGMVPVRRGLEKLLKRELAAASHPSVRHARRPTQSDASASDAQG